MENKYPEAGLHFCTQGILSNLVYALRIYSRGYVRSTVIELSMCRLYAKIGVRSTVIQLCVHSCA